MTNGGSTRPTGVLLVGTGCPAAPSRKAVTSFLSHLLSDSRLCPLPRPVWWMMLRNSILPAAVPAIAEKYEALWTEDGLPYLSDHKAIAAALDARYSRFESSVVVRFGLCYGDPSLSDALEGLAQQGCGKLVVLPLFAQGAFALTGLARDAVERALKKVRWDGEVVFAEPYGDDDIYVRAIASAIERAGFDIDSDDRVLFSFQSVPLADIEAGDSYELQVGSTCLSIAAELGLERRRWTIGYHGMRGTRCAWLSPSTRNILASWSEAPKVPRVFVVCPGYAVDGFESEYEIGREMRFEYLSALAEPRGDGMVYVPCLNGSRAQVRVLAHVLGPYVGDEL